MNKYVDGGEIQENDSNEPMDRPYQEERRPEPVIREEPHNSDGGPCYCPYCWSGM